MFRTSALVDHQLGADDNCSVVGPFSPRQEEDNNKRDDGNNASTRSSDSCLVDRLGKGVEPRESRFGRHLDQGLVLDQASLSRQRNWYL